MVATEHADVILRDGRTLRLRPPALRRRRRACWPSSARCRSGASTCATTASRRSARGSSSRSSSRTGRSAGCSWARSSTRTASGSSPSPTTSACATPSSPRPRSRSPTSTRAAASERVCSSSSRRARPRSGSSASSPTCCRTTAPCSASSSRQASQLTRELEGGEVEVQFPIAPTESYREHVEARDHEAVVASLEPFFRPRSVAVIGASQAPRLDRRRAVPQHPRRRLRRRRLPGQPRRRAGGRRPRLRLDRGDPRPGRPRGDHACRPRRSSARREQALRKGVRALVVISAGFAEIGSEGAGAAGAAARARPLLRRAADRAQLPRHRRLRAEPERDLRRPLGARRQHRLLLAERRARPCPPGGRRVARPRPVGVRVDRQQGRRLHQRPARVVGGRRDDRGRAHVRRVVRQSAPLRPARPPRRPYASRSSRSRAERPRAGSARRARTRLRWPAPRWPSTRSSTRPASSARPRSRSSSTSRRCSPTSPS